MRARLFLPVCLALSLSLSNCTTREDTGGYVNDVDFKNEVMVGKTTKDEVNSKFGSPSTQSSFGAETWYYITDKTATFAFFKPKVVEQDVTEIEFDSAGLVSNLRQYTKKDGRDIAIARRTTPTEGHTLGFFEQVLGNLGRFNAPGKDKDTAAPGRKPSGGF